MACKSNPKKSFTFTWILENFEYCGKKTKEFLKSPTFIADTIERSKWSLWIFPRGYESERWICLYLRREGDSKGPTTIEVDYELAFLSSEGSALISLDRYKRAFMKNEGWGSLEFQERESVFAKKSAYLPQNILTIRCRMWKSTGEMQMDGLCVARTRIGIEKKVFLWKIDNFITLDERREITFKLKSTSDDQPIMFLKLFLRKSWVSSDILIKFVLLNKNIIFSTFKSSLVDAQGNYVNCGHHEFWPSPASGSEEFALSISKDTIMMDRCLYLPNNFLVLQCEQIFSTGIVFEGIENTSYGCPGSFINNNVVPANIETVCVKKPDSDISDLKADLNSMLQDNVLCDVKLNTKSETFSAHWFILTARSPVFRAMFKNDMKEKAKDRIDIKDMKPDTVRRMLLYLYTDSLEELDWEIASDLYVAAEKYQILALKDKCSSFLKTNLSLINACEILLLADLHQDTELKTAVQNFILDNDKIIINSSEWKLLMEANVHLAAETMLLRFKK
ncbi:speckle-type POZ protein B-like isoform X3 [Argiope bruennichi]|uniref:speckle-type POZ protein B-like isoform X3 n=1 Tax=Argiope bruennichi TaxID=94029 RepID=UPI002495949C|nr:speckle-type POZ protein B-like isoform X3 [Argiope bruennichi]XP_055952082.1 speckle-type POZ protein B-like isoform X3 [Argiope bruennichi]